MRFGVVLPTYPETATVTGIVEVAEAAERLGFDSIWTTDHVILPADHGGPYRSIYEPLQTLAYLAALTHRVKLGISVIVVPQRNGVVLAKEIATLDQLAHGRLIVGVGSGWSEPEFRMLGASAVFHHRGRLLDETIRLWRHLWTDPGTPFKGRFYDLPAVAFGPSPAQGGEVPIWVGGSSEAAERRAGRLGQAWHPVGIDPAGVEAGAPVVRRAAEDAGRSMPEVTVRLPMVVGERVGSGPVSANPQRVVAGEPEQLVAELRAYAQAGVAEIDCLFGSGRLSTVEQMERFSALVMPALAG